MAQLPEHIAQGYEELRLCAEAVAQLATHRDITPMHVNGVKTDRQIRKVLTSIVRLHGASEPAHYFSEASTVGDEKIDKDHIVPVRALVDRMIINPNECGDILGSIVLAEVTKMEHKQLSGLWADHPDAYEKMLTLPVEHLLEAGLERYQNAGIVLHQRVF